VNDANERSRTGSGRARRDGAGLPSVLVPRPSGPLPYAFDAGQPADTAGSAS
jgi:hypothetical protein